MHQQTILDQVEVSFSTGIIGIRFAKQIIRDNGDIATSSWHRAALEKGNDPDAVMADVNAHLSEMSEAPVSADDIAKIKAIAAAAWSAMATQSEVA